MAEVCAFLLSTIAHTEPNEATALLQKNDKTKKMKKTSTILLLTAATLAFYACNKSDENSPRLSQKAYTLHPDETQVIEGTNISGLIWESDNEFAATVKDGTITAKFVGRTNITADNLTLPVEVKPKNHLYDEPSMDWGASKETICAKYGTPINDKDNSLMFKTNNSKAPYYIFLFDEKGMSASGVVVELSAGMELVDFLIERYLPVDVDTSRYSATFVHAYGKISDPQTDYGAYMRAASTGDILVAYTAIGTKTRTSEQTVHHTLEIMDNLLL